MSRHNTVSWLVIAFVCLWMSNIIILVSAEKIELFSKYATLCKRKTPPLTPSKHRKALEWLLDVTGEASLFLEESPQHQAACWMFYDDPLRLTSINARFKQRYSLAVFYFATKGQEKWKESKNWMTKKHECTWYGIGCDWNFLSRIVTKIEISFNDVDGLLPRELSLLTELRELDLHGNDLQGVLPHKCLVAWKKLEYLRLHMNGFFGSLHSEIGKLKSLKELQVFGNYFGGSLPSELGNLKNLEVIDVYANTIEGTIPTQLGKLKKLRELDVHDNFVSGRMPEPVCQLKLDLLVSDCLDSKNPEVLCSGSCCTHCCQGVPEPMCKDMKTGKIVEKLP